MIEIIDSIVQMIAAAVCTAVAFYRAFKYKKNKDISVNAGAPMLNQMVGRREWILLGLFSGEYLLGDLFSTLYLFFFGETPKYYISDISWYTSYLFLLLLILYVSDKGSIRMISKWQLLIPVFTVGMGVFFVVTSGDIMGNIVSVVIMTGVIWLAGGALEREKQEMKTERSASEGDSDETERVKKPGKCFFYRMCLIVVAAEYGFWVTSTYWMGDTLANPYFWFGALFSASFIVMIPAVKRAIDATNLKKEAQR